MAITIKEQSREFTKLEKYLMTKSNDIVVLKNVEDGTQIDVSGYLIYEDVKEDGTVVELLSIITPENEVFSCQSPTFKNDFIDIAEIYEDEEVFTIVKHTATSKNGRDFIYCVPLY